MSQAREMTLRASTVDSMWLELESTECFVPCPLCISGKPVVMREVKIKDAIKLGWRYAVMPFSLTGESNDALISPDCAKKESAHVTS